MESELDILSAISFDDVFIVLVQGAPVPGIPEVLIQTVRYLKRRNLFMFVT